jgi:hypothetical protein
MEGRERERELDFDLGATPLLLSLSLGEVAAFTRKSLLSSDRQSPTLSWFYCFIAVSRASCMTELQATDDRTFQSRNEKTPVDDWQ